MERVEFLIEATHERVPCLLNPESLTIERTTGIQRVGGQLASHKLTDDPVHYSGRGSTSFQLQLLFDVNLSDLFVETRDVRDLTQPLWQLTEYVRADEIFDELPRIRFIWGRVWNLRVVISSISQQFQYVARNGIPERALLNMSLMRVSDEQHVPETASPVHPTLKDLPSATAERLNETTSPSWGIHILLADERLEQVAAKYYGQPQLWRLIAIVNPIDDLLNIPPGTALRIPPLHWL
ncbi:MAG: hypothetical protein AAF614_08030 [Chloroflexota bacterium]